LTTALGMHFSSRVSEALLLTLEADIEKEAWRRDGAVNTGVFLVGQMRTARLARLRNRRR